MVDGACIPAPELPAIKLLANETPIGAIQRLLSERFSGIAESLVLGQSPRTETREATSTRFGVRTTYLRTIFDADLVSTSPHQRSTATTARLNPFPSQKNFKFGIACSADNIWFDSLR